MKNIQKVIFVFLLFVTLPLPGPGLNTTCPTASENASQADVITLPFQRCVTLTKNKSNYFEFTLSSTQSVSVLTSNATENINAYIRDASGTLRASQNGNADISLAANNLPAGTYTLEIENTSSQNVTTYNINVTALSISKEANVTSLTGGGTIHFTMSLEAYGDFSDINITDDVQVVYNLSNIHNLSADTSLNCSETSEDVLTCSNGSIENGQTLTIGFDANASDVTATTTNTVEYIASPHLEGSASASIDLTSSNGGGGPIDIGAYALLIGISEHNISYIYDEDNSINPIKTKIVNKTFTVDVTHLDHENDGAPKAYDGTTSVNFNIYIVDQGTLDGSCGSIIGAPLFGSGTFNPGDTIVPVTGTITEAHKIKALRSDTGVFGFLGSEGTGSLQSSLCAVPASFNSETQIFNYYYATYPEVTICTQGDGTPGTAAACASNAYTGSCGGKKESITISPAKYNHDLGCLNCLADVVGSCSNLFAIRPDQFNTTIQYYEALVAGHNYTKTFYAYDYNGTGAQNYNETEGVSFDVNITIADINKTCAVTNLNFPSFTFVDGLKDVNFSLGDIGDFNLTIAEINGSEFALIDQDDTPDEDRLITPFTVPIHVIPDHFTIDANLTDHNSDNNFTYLHDINTYESEDNHSMGALLSMNISAMGADENITTNYIQGCYAKETNLTLLLSDINITYPGSTPAITQFLYYNPNEDNGTAHSGESSYALPSLTNITQLPLANNAATFSSDAPDGNGTAHIEYKLNFDRKQNLPVNPFKLTLLDANITDEDNVTGSDEVNQSAHFFYARSRASQFFYEDVTDANITTPILIDVYCGLGFTACDSLGVNTVNGQINEINWWLSLEHNATHGDGNITLTKGSITEGSSSDWYVSPTANITTNAIDPTVSVGRGSAPALPLTVEIELDAGTNHWLIYNPNDPILTPSPFYKVRFIGTSGWAGYGDTGHVVETNASVKKHNRLEW